MHRAGLHKIRGAGFYGLTSDQTSQTSIVRMFLSPGDAQQKGRNAEGGRMIGNNSPADSPS